MTTIDQLILVNALQEQPSPSHDFNLASDVPHIAVIGVHSCGKSKILSRILEWLDWPISDERPRRIKGDLIEKSRVFMPIHFHILGCARMDETLPEGCDIQQYLSRLWCQVESRQIQSLTWHEILHLFERHLECTGFDYSLVRVRKIRTQFRFQPKPTTKFKITDRYDILGGPIGEGIGGAVFRVRDRVTEKLYALKKINSSHFNDCEYYAKCVAREVEINEILQQLDEPEEYSVRYIKHFMDWEGNLYLLLELCATDLAKILHQDMNKIFPREQSIAMEPCYFISCKIFEDLLNKLQKLHDNNILHRDLKPSNVMFDEHGHFKIGDYGLSKILGHKHIDTQTGGLQCTPKYRAPEVLDGNYGLPADWYSLGVVGRDIFEHSIESANNGSDLNLQDKIEHLKNLIVRLTMEIPNDRVTCQQALNEIQSWSIDISDLTITEQFMEHLNKTEISELPFTKFVKFHLNLHTDDQLDIIKAVVEIEIGYF